MKNSQLLLALLCFGFINLNGQQSQQLVLPNNSPDYSNLYLWAAHPEKSDSADLVPRGSELVNGQDLAKVDVFFIHPTTLTKKKDKRWNADLNDEKLNLRTDKSTIKYQASIFNGSCKVYAPRYRQAHYRSYDEFLKNPENPNVLSAFEQAYQDVKSSFEYYLENFNQGRPIIIASHSQGSTHSQRLLKEFFDGKELSEKLVAAYVVGMPVKASQYEELLPCENADETSCYNCWATYGWGAKTKDYHEGTVTTNPINWKRTDEYASREESKGMVIRPFAKIKKKLMDAQVKNGIIWVHKPDIPGKIFLIGKNFHIGDFNLFYMDVRYNVKNRIDHYLKKQESKVLSKAEE